MYSILTLNKISSKGLSIFGDGYTYSSEEKNPDAVLVRSTSMHEFQLTSSTVAVARAGAGTNNIPILKYTEGGIVVFNTPSANANAVKELVIAGLLLSSRKIIPAVEWVKTLKDSDDAVKRIESGKSAFSGPEISGKTLGIIGLGAVGRLVANSAVSLGMIVIGYDPYLTESEKKQIHSSVNVIDNLNDIFKFSDYISLHVPLNDTTKNLIGKDSISLMKENVRILNFARGELVDSHDIKEALKTKKVAVYVTDFPNGDLICTDGVIAVPHLAASTPEAEENCAVMAVKQVKKFLENGSIINSVNFPSVILNETDGHRMAVIHKVDTDAISKITATLVKENINTVNMESCSNGKYSYTVIDTDTYISTLSLKAVNDINGVIRVRRIK